MLARVFMARKIKYGKITAVVLITVLIWVWADLALDKEETFPNATISVARSINPRLLVTFDDDQSSVSIAQIKLKGPATRISKVKSMLAEGSLKLEFFLDAQEQQMAAPKQYRFDVLDFLKKSSKIRDLGLSVESCKPEVLTVNVTALVEKSLEVKCRDDARNEVKTASVEPPQVKMFVPESWEGENLVAWVTLTRREIEDARSSAIDETPFVELTADQNRDVPRSVKIMTAPEEELLSDYTITSVTVGIRSSTNLQGIYDVKITNLDALMSPISIRATQEAALAYENMMYQVTLDIDDSDADYKSAEPQRRELIYNFPEYYVRRDEIKLKSPRPVEARFKLIPLAPGGGPATGGP